MCLQSLEAPRNRNFEDQQVGTTQHPLHVGELQSEVRELTKAPAEPLGRWGPVASPPHLSFPLEAQVRKKAR
jgi:hypothetical protein